MVGFQDVESVWAQRLGGLRNTVRQHVIATQLGEHLDGVTTVLDVGCGQGTQAVHLAARGFEVTGVDRSADLLGRMSDAAEQAGVSVRGVIGDLFDLDRLLGDERFDLVCAHGVLMYFDDQQRVMRHLARRVASGGRLSFTVRNGDALAFRPGIQGDYAAALAAFDASHYRNNLGADARANRFDEVVGWCDGLGMTIESWYGVRVFTDCIPLDTPVDPATVDDCLAAEVEAGRRDPYRRFGSQLHFVTARR